MAACTLWSPSLTKRVVSDRYDPLARVAVYGAEGVELLEEDLAKPGLLLELAPRGFIERLVEAHEPARQCPLAFERRQRPLNQHHLQLFLVQAEDDAVDG